MKAIEVRREIERLNRDNANHVCTPETCPEDGCYYVSCVDDSGHPYLMAGPYQNHAGALADKNKALTIADKIDGRAWFMTWGTVHMKDGTRTPGRLNEHGLMSASA